MIPQIVKKINISKLRIKKYVDWDYHEVPTKLLAELNITEYEPFQIIDKEKGEWDGKWGIVQEFWVRDWQIFYIIPESRLDYYFTHLFKALKKKKAVIIPGCINKIVGFFSKFCSYHGLAKTTGKMWKKSQLKRNI